jgi:hypothetical protein
MRAQFFSQLYELDRIAEGFASILTAAKCPNVGFNRGASTDQTPRVEIFMTAETNEGRRFLADPFNASSTAQPYDTWNARFEIDVVTNRETNREEARKLIGLVRYNFQLFRLIETWTENVSPYHSITSMIEVGEQAEIDNEDNTDTTRVVFEGLVNIRADAWPIPAYQVQIPTPAFDLEGPDVFLLEADGI